MISQEPIPGNPWPHEMVITIEDGPHALEELLWIREAWNLQPEGSDLPPLLTDTPAPVEADRPAVAGDWQREWPGLWNDCVTHAAEAPDRGLLTQLMEETVEPELRADMLQRLVGPSWRDRFGDDALTDAYRQWSLGLFERRAAGRPVAYAETPERIALDALVPAWRAGLTRLVLIPCRGTFTRRIGSASLLLTEETRTDPARYAAALASFE